MWSCGPFTKWSRMALGPPPPFFVPNAVFLSKMYTKCTIFIDHIPSVKEKKRQIIYYIVIKFMKFEKKMLEILVEIISTGISNYLTLDLKNIKDQLYSNFKFSNCNITQSQTI